MAAATVVSAGCQLLSTSFRKDSLSSNCGESLEAVSQSCFQGTPMSSRLCRPATPRSICRSAAAPTNAALATFPGNFAAEVQEDDVMRREDDEDADENVVSSTCEFLETVNAVVADVVDGQKFLKEKGRTKPRPIKRRSLVMCFALGAIKPYLTEVEDRVVNLRRTASSSFARTCQLVSQISIGASKAAEMIADEQRQLVSQISIGASKAANSIADGQRQLVSQLSIGASKAASSIADGQRQLVSQISIGASKVAKLIVEEQSRLEYDRLTPAAA